MIRRTKAATTAFANPVLVRDLERAATQASMDFSAVAMAVLRGEATEDQKAEALKAASDASAALKAEQKNIVSI